MQEKKINDGKATGELGCSAKNELSDARCRRKCNLFSAETLNRQKGGSGVEPRTLEELYRRYAGELYLYAYSLCQNEAQAQDLTAEAFCRALLALDGADAGWRSWLYKVCRNLWLDQVRRSRRLAPEPPGPELAAEGDVLEELLQDPAVPGAEEAEEQIGGTDMTFRELLDKYRAGQASEEERALVEAELEKSEAIADYLAEQVEDALGAAETQAPAGEVWHIQKKVNRRLRRTAVWAACIVLAALLGVRFVVSPLVSSLYYQPNEKGFGTGIEGEPDPEYDAITLDLTALYSLIAPGDTVNSVTAQPEGFGRYTLTYELQDWLAGETEQITGTLDASKDGGWVRSSGSNYALATIDSMSGASRETSSTGQPAATRSGCPALLASPCAARPSTASPPAGRTTPCSAFTRCIGRGAFPVGSSTSSTS